MLVRTWRRLGAAAALGLLAAAGAGLISLSSFARGLENSTYDWRLVRTARPGEARHDIALVEINEASVRALTPVVGSWPWPRVLHAGVIDFLHRAGARVIAYDVLFTEPDRRGAFTLGDRTLSGAQSDAELAAAVKEAGNVVLLSEVTYEGTAGPDSNTPPASAPGIGREAQEAGPSRGPEGPRYFFDLGPGFQVRPTLLAPYDGLRQAAFALGHNMLVLDGRTEQDAIVRRFLPFVHIADANVDVPSLGLAAALAARGFGAADLRLEPDALDIGAARMPLLSTPAPSAAGPVPSRQVLLNFRGPSVDAEGTPTYPTYSFFNVLLSDEQLSEGRAPAIDPSAFRDKIVFVGVTTAAGLAQDVFTTPFKQVRTPGMQIHAALADDVLSNRFMRRAGWPTDAAVTVGAGLATGLLTVLLPVWAGLLAAAGLAAGLAAALTYAVGAGVWMALVAPLAAVAVAAFEGVGWRYLVEGREKRQIKHLFGRYVSRDVFDALLADPSLARLGGERREMTVLFSDIRSFTTASERMRPEAVVEQLNEYFTAMVRVLLDHHGTLDKFVGDELMGLFGAPVADPQHADHAVAAAIAMSRELERLNAGWSAAGRPTLDIGIGISTGEMIAGNIGSDAVMSYTVIGDTVNLGARLEGLNKEYGTRIIMSDATKAALRSEVETRSLGEVRVKGKTQAVRVHAVVER